MSGKIKKFVLVGMMLGLMPITSNAVPIEVSDFGIWTLDNQVSADWQNAVGSTRTNAKMLDLFLDGFDSSLGTLLNVSLSFTSNWILTHEVQGEDRTGGIFGEDNIYVYGNASQTLMVDLVSPSGTTASQSAYQAASCSDNDGGCSQNIGGPGVFNDLLTFSNLSDFIDISSVHLRAGNTIVGVSDVDDFDDYHKFVARNTWYGMATITYRYDMHSPDPEPNPIPEPSTLALFGMGLLGLGLARKRAA